MRSEDSNEVLDSVVFNIVPKAKIESSLVVGTYVKNITCLRGVFHMEPVFLYERWLRKTIFDFLTISRPPELRGRIISMSPKEYGAVLMQAYLGGVGLSWIGEQLGMDPELLKLWRKQPEFLFATDWSKALFCEVFKEEMILNDYSVVEYHQIAGEFSLLEETLRVRIRVPLYARLKDLGSRLISHSKYNISVDRYELQLFKRLFLFFFALEYHWPSPAKKRLNEEFRPFAADVVWPACAEGNRFEHEFLFARDTEPLSFIISELSKRLKETFKHVPSKIFR